MKTLIYPTYLEALDANNEKRGVYLYARLDDTQIDEYYRGNLGAFPVVDIEFRVATHDARDRCFVRNDIDLQEAIVSAHQHATKWRGVHDGTDFVCTDRQFLILDKWIANEKRRNKSLQELSTEAINQYDGLKSAYIAHGLHLRHVRGADWQNKLLGL